jgi:ketosteroid isomerase-like protein
MSTSPSEADNKQLVRDFFTTLSSGDLEALKAFFDDDSTWGVTMLDNEARVRTGPKEIIDDFLVPVREGLYEPGNPKVHIENLWADGDWVIAETVATGPMLNGHDYRNEYVFVIQVDGRKIRQMREYMDTAYIARVSTDSPR